LAATQTQLKRGAVPASPTSTINVPPTTAYQAEQARLAEVARQAALAAQAAAEAARRAGAGAGNGGGRGDRAEPDRSMDSRDSGRPRRIARWPTSAGRIRSRAGNASGPTYGVAVDYDSRNDARVFWLRLFWAEPLRLVAVHSTHSLRRDPNTNQAGSIHPNTASLMPGDLVFWSDNGTVSGIGHVAIYIGNGNVVQAPFSGSYIQITPLSQVEPGYYGATRPLT